MTFGLTYDSVLAFFREVISECKHDHIVWKSPKMSLLHFSKNSSNQPFVAFLMNVYQLLMSAQLASLAILNETFSVNFEHCVQNWIGGMIHKNRANIIQVQIVNPLFEKVIFQSRFRMYQITLFSCMWNFPFQKWKTCKRLISLMISRFSFCWSLQPFTNGFVHK